MKRSLSLVMVLVILLAIFAPFNGLQRAGGVQKAQAAPDAWTTTYYWYEADGTYSDISGGTALCTASSSVTCDNVVYTQAMGMTFNYDGTNRTTAYISTNGFLCLSSAPAADLVLPISGATNNCISAMGRDLRARRDGSTYGVLSYVLEGTAPKRAFVVQYKNWQSYDSQNTTYYNFQIRLYETSNVIEVKYGDYSTGSSSKNFEIGLRGPTSSDYKNRKCATCTDWKGSSAGTANTDTMTLKVADGYHPNSGLTWIWTPKDPTAVAATQPVAKVMGNAIQIAWQTQSEANIAGFNLYRSTAADGAGRSLIYNTAASNPGTTLPGSYQFSDAQVQSGLRYYYWLEVLGRDGSSELMSPTSVLVSRIFLPSVRR
jgi:hypothetical protein